jgi:hypothetical protein
VFDVHRETAALLEGLRNDVLAQRSAFFAASDRSGPAALDDRRANRKEMLVVEITATLRHLRRARRPRPPGGQGAACR